MSELEPPFPLEFIVEGTPISAQSATTKSKNKWKARVKSASNSVLPEGHFASSTNLAVTLYYFPPEKMQGDVDNIVKLIIDALNKHVYLDDSQIERVVVQKFEPGSAFSFSGPTAVLTDALTRKRPILYIRISDDPLEELQ